MNQRKLEAPLLTGGRDSLRFLPSTSQHQHQRLQAFNALIPTLWPVRALNTPRRFDLHLQAALLGKNIFGFFFRAKMINAISFNSAKPIFYMDANADRDIGADKILLQSSRNEQRCDGWVLFYMPCVRKWMKIYFLLSFSSRNCCLWRLWQSPWLPR